MSLMRIVRPSGSSSPKRFAFTVVPITQTRWYVRSSSSEKNRPSSTDQLRISGMSVETPVTRLCQFFP